MILISFVYKRILMKSFILVLLILSVKMVSIAQQNHFVYLQTDNKQSFYVKINDKLFSSSSSGYAVIPKLQTGSYSFTIGFPKNEWPQQTVTIKIDNNDLGFILKIFGDKGWGLFNIQTLNVTMASSAIANTLTPVAQNKTDGFSNVLADVVNTPALKEEKIEKIVADSLPSLNTPIAIIPAKEFNSVKIITTTLDNNGRFAKYIDSTENTIDTVQLFIPYEKIAVENSVKEEKPKEKKEEIKPEAKFLNIELPNPNSTRDTTNNKTAQVISEVVSIMPQKEVPAITINNEPLKPANEPSLKPLSINSDCKSLANENDFMKLRKKMVAENKDDDMISVARKAFKSNCFSTEQIKNLGVLFLKEEGRYRFFDASYPFVYDSQNYNALQAQLTDEYLINRFKAMIRH